MMVNREQILSRIRPLQIQSALVCLIAGTERRVIVEDPSGTLAYVDPYNNAGIQVIHGGYEPETLQTLEELLAPGDVFLDVGANEGLVSAFAGRLVGAAGRVIAVEPQGPLIKLIRINAALNQVHSLAIVNAAFGGADGDAALLNLFPDLNSGGASIVRKHRLTFRPSRKIPVAFTTLDSVMSRLGVVAITLAKIDVEGFEPEVVNSMLPNLSRGDVRYLLVDYHVQILDSIGKSPSCTHERLLEIGMIAEWGEPLAGGYVLYRSATAGPSITTEQEDAFAASVNRA